MALTWQGVILAVGLAVGGVSMCGGEVGAQDAVPPGGALLGTVVVSDDPSLSSALIAPEVGGISEGYAIGSRYQGWTLVRIERTRIALRHDDGSVAWLELGPASGSRSGE
ncbi:MAG: hypothetical protein AAF602_08040 [Myxococcota bacterium]